VPGLIACVTALLNTMIEAHDRRYIETGDFARTVAIPTRGISATDFALTEAQSSALYASGRRAAEAVLATWDFARCPDAYSAQTPTRRALISAMMRQTEAPPPSEAA
jgi:NTE family protein